MAPEESVPVGRMGIALFVGMAMMMAVVSGPPEGSLLNGAVAPDGEKELGPARCLEGTVGKVTMVKARNGEHSDEVKGHSRQDRNPAPTHPDHSEAHQVEAQEGDRPDPVNLFEFTLRDGLAIGLVVEPSNH